MEKNEALDAKWIPLSEYQKYQWAWNHKDLLEMFGKLVFGDSAFDVDDSNKEIRCMFKCPDGVKLEIFGTSTTYRNVDYADYATYKYDNVATPAENFKRAYNRCINSFGTLKPLTKDAYILSLLK
jgi:hypothetical protein